MVAVAVVAALAAALRAPIGVDAFTRIDLLPLLQPNVQTHEFTSYDRAGDNYDADYFPLYPSPSGEQVLFDSYGPGCLYRLHMNIWNGDVSGVNIRFYFDDEPKPRIDMDVTKFFSPTNPLGIFEEPTAHIGEGYRIAYHPFFYLRRLKVALSKEPLGNAPGWDKLPWLGRYDKHPYRRNHWYEFTYHTYSEDPGIRSWTRPANMRPVAAVWDTARIGKPYRTFRAAATVERHVEVPAGGRTQVIDLRGEKTITALKCDFAGRDAQALFDTWLQITFDGAKKPQVDVPLGCFFGIDPYARDKAIASLPVGTLGGTMYCYLPMPFWASASVALVSRGKAALPPTHVTLEVTPASSLPFDRAKSGYFHAVYARQEPRTEGHDYRYADLQGAGKIVGHFAYRTDTSMEEDERTYFDGSGTPWIIGEGYEDDHNQGWGLKDLRRAMWGSTASDGGAGAPWRFTIPDAYVFQSAVRFGHQVYGPHSPRGHEGMYTVGDEQSVVFAYVQDGQALVQTDELALGDGASVRAHRYRPAGRAVRRTGAWWYDGEFNNVLFPTPAIRDVGYADRGSEFTMRLDPDNHGVRLRRRTDKENNQQLAKVFVDGRPVTERPWYSVDFERTFRGIRWFDSDFEIPARYTRGKRSVRVRIQFVSSKTGVWDEFRYWAFCHVAPASRASAARAMRG